MPSLKATIRAVAAAFVVSAAASIGTAAAQAGNFPKGAPSNRASVRAAGRALGPPAGIPGRWRLVLDSAFHGPRLPQHWHTGWFGKGVTAPVNPAELACYSPTNVSFPGDGSMHLNVTAQPSSCGGETRPYTGAMVTTDPAHGASGFTYEYGVLQARVYIPAAHAHIADWPAVWADGQSWPADGEDDLMEGLDGTACFHFHDPLGHAGGCDRRLIPGWHTFASEWLPGSVVYYYDGARVGAVFTGITAAPMYVALDNTVSGRAATASVDDSMRVQYVRVWQHG